MIWPPEVLFNQLLIEIINLLWFFNPLKSTHFMLPYIKYWKSLKTNISEFLAWLKKKSWPCDYFLPLNSLNRNEIELNVVAFYVKTHLKMLHVQQTIIDVKLGSILKATWWCSKYLGPKLNSDSHLIALSIIFSYK